MEQSKMKSLLSKCLGEMVNPNDNTNSCIVNQRQDWIHLGVVHLLSSESFSHTCPAYNIDGYREGLLRDWQWAMKGTILYWSLLCSSHCSGPLRLLSHLNLSAASWDKALSYPFLKSANWDSTKLRNLLKVTQKRGVNSWILIHDCWPIVIFNRLEGF